MADETTAAATPAPQPVTETASHVAAAETTAQETPAVETPKADAAPEAPKADTPVAEAKPETPVEEAKPLLDPETPKEEAPKVEDAKTNQEAPKAEEVPLPVYEFTLPEGAKSDTPSFKVFTTKLGEFQNLAKADHAAAQKFGQELIDMHLEEMKAAAESQNRASWDWFNNRNKEWLDAAKSDPVIGGENFDKTVSEASQAVRLYGGTKAQQLETAKLLQTTGLENSPVMLRFLSNITKIAAKEGEPVKSQNTPAQKPSIAESMYGKKTA